MPDREYAREPGPLPASAGTIYRSLLTLDASRSFNFGKSHTIKEVNQNGGKHFGYRYNEVQGF